MFKNHLCIYLYLYEHMACVGLWPCEKAREAPLARGRLSPRTWSLHSQLDWKPTNPRDLPVSTPLGAGIYGDTQLVIWCWDSNASPRGYGPSTLNC